ncbi:MAG TPA: ATP-binding protein [Solirubrobacterales bacterium]|nr:ATP-binding protein [Solirubrobacterales bacterium]
MRSTASPRSTPGSTSGSGRAPASGEPLALSWSGGKDSALALWALREELGVEPLALLTTVTEDYDRISMHGVRGELLRAQARATGIELVEIPIPAACANEVYEQRMATALARPPLDRAETIAFADLFLADIRSYREERLATIGRDALFPLWERDTTELAHGFIAAGFEATLVCVDPARLDSSFVGRRFDEALLADLPHDVDSCGENGEFHTFVHAGPIFSAPVGVELGEVVIRDGFAFCDLLAASAGVAPGADHNR